MKFIKIIVDEKPWCCEDCQLLFDTEEKIYPIYKCLITGCTPLKEERLGNCPLLLEGEQEKYKLDITKN